MKKFSFLVLFSALCVSYAQKPSFDNIKFWTGSGEKVAMLIIDFNDDTTNDCYAWGYRYDADTITALNMLEAIAQADPNLSYVGAGGFVSDINYLSHSGVGGSPNWWSTFNFEDSEWISNMGYSEVLTDSLIFGNSYTETDADYNPINLPESPIAAKKPFITNTDEVVYWVGSGSKKAYLVIDFNDGATDECYIWGYKFDADTLTFANMMNDISNDDSQLSISFAGGFIGDIIYKTHSGLNGDPYYWSTFTLTNHLWEMNMGASDPLEENSIFSLSYTDWDDSFNPIYEPEDAVPASLNTKIAKNNNTQISISPNPTSDILFIKDLEVGTQLSIFTSNGTLVHRSVAHDENTQVNVSNFSNGTYILKMKNGISNQHLIFIKQ